MSELALVMVRISIVLLAALLATVALRRRAAELRHWTLAAGMACAALTPVFTTIVPSWQVATPEVRHATPPNRAATETVGSGDMKVSPVAPATPATDITWPTLLGGTWLTGTVTALALLWVGLSRLRRLGRRAHDAGALWREDARAISATYGLRLPVAILESDHAKLLVTYGARHPVILLPVGASQWSAERRRIVLGHELAHIARRDWPIQLAAAVMRATLWINPLVWVACRRLRQESEYACDDLVLRHGIARTNYARHLLDIARAFHRPDDSLLPALAIARPSTLQRRIRAMLNVNLDRRPLSRAIRVGAAVALLALALPIAGFSAQKFGTVSGTIADTTGGFIRNATLTLAAANSARREVTSDETGHFEFVGVPAGDYVLVANVHGFGDFREAVSVAVGQTVVRAISLQLGTLQERISVTFSDADAPAPVASGRPAAITPETKPCAPSSEGGRIATPIKLKDMRPRVPQSLRDAKSDAQVIVEATIATDGTVRDARALSPVDPDVEEAATFAVKQWLFSTTTLNCVPVEVKMTVTVQFTHRP